jgi:hypothetical protein
MENGNVHKAVVYFTSCKEPQRKRSNATLNGERRGWTEKDAASTTRYCLELVLIQLGKAQLQE